MLQMALQSCSVKWAKGTSGETATTAMVERLEVQDLTLGSVGGAGGGGAGSQQGRLAHGITYYLTLLPICAHTHSL